MTKQEHHDPALPEIKGRRIAEDERGNVCLNDLWELAERPDNLDPPQWKRHKKTIALKGALDERILCATQGSADNASATTYYVRGRGRKAQTFAHPVLALEYAEALNPALGIEVKEIFLRYRANDISLANDILDRIIEQVREDETRLHVRSEISDRNRELASEGRKAGCIGWQYAELHNSGYRGLYNGLDEGGIHRLKKLTKNQKILDHMIAAEGAANLFRVTQAKVAMQERRPKTAEAAFDIAHQAGVETRRAMERIGGIMPEDMPVADSIKDAKKRLERNKHLLPKEK